jgi:hypothetical protein
VLELAPDLFAAVGCVSPDAPCRSIDVPIVQSSATVSISCSVEDDVRKQELSQAQQHAACSSIDSHSGRYTSPHPYFDHESGCVSSGICLSIIHLSSRSRSRPHTEYSMHHTRVAR